jgi:lauroyl/myristoyl acyltransferase
MPTDPSRPTSSPQTAAARPDDTKIVSVTDLAVLSSLPLLFTISWLVPQQAWRRFCRAVGPLAVPMLAGDRQTVLQVMRRTLGARRLGGSAEAILSELAGEQILTILQLLRDYRPGGWRPEIRLAGLDHVEAALARGRGAILWVGFSVYGDLIAKMAFHRAGLGVSHLSRASHGFSATRFGMGCLNPIQMAVENRYLGARVMLSPSNANAALKTLAARLGENGVVTFTVHRNAKRPVVVPFLDGELFLAPGAPLLAHRTKAALIPVFAFRDAAGVHTVTFEPPLDVPQDLPKEHVIQSVGGQYAALLEPYVLKHPGQWRGWLHL